MLNRESNFGNVDYYYNHFNLRLKERYNLSLTLEEYLEYCNKEIDFIYDISCNKRFGSLKIKGVDTWVIRDNGARLLNTVILIDEQRLPLPIDLRLKGLDGIEFNSLIQNKLKIIDELVSLLTNGMSRRDLFVNRPFNYPKWIYVAAEKKERGFLIFEIIVKNLFYDTVNER
jgi:hypothetical protein